MSQAGFSESLPACVLNASALLALLHAEPGADFVEPLLERAVVCSVNWSEVVQKALAWGVEVEGMREALEALGLDILPFTPEDAEQTARLWSKTRQVGLSLGDRACLSLARRLGVPVLTCDSAWQGLDSGVEVQIIR